MEYYEIITNLWGLDRAESRLQSGMESVRTEATETVSINNSQQPQGALM